MKQTLLFLFFIVYLVYLSQICLATCNITDDYYVNSSIVLSANETNCNVQDSGATGVVIINASNIVLECSGNWTLNGTGTGAGITNSSQLDNVTIKNCRIENYSINLYLQNIENSSIINNTLQSPTSSNMHLSSPINLTIANNTVNYGVYGLYFHSTQQNITLINNTISGTSSYGLYLLGSSDASFNNSISTSNTVDGKPIYYLSDVANQTYSSINMSFFTCIRCDNITINNITITGGSRAIDFWRVNNSLVENITLTSNNIGLYMKNSYNNTINNSIFDSNSYGIQTHTCGYNTIRNSTFDSNSYMGILLEQSENNTVTMNSIISSTWGIDISSHNNISFNNVSLVTVGITIDSTSVNVTVENNSVSSSTSAAFQIFGTDHIVRYNTGTDNAAAGLYHYSLLNTTLLDNRIENENDFNDTLFEANGSVIIELNHTGEKIGYELLWKKDYTGYNDEFAGPIIVNDIIYIASKNYKILFTINETTGEEIWNYTTGSIDDTPMYNNDTVYVTSGYSESADPYKKVWALNASTGAVIWNFTLPDRGGGTVAYWDNKVYATNRDTPIIFCLNASSTEMLDTVRQLWNYTRADLDDYESTVTIVDGIVYGGMFSSTAKTTNIFALNATNSTDIWNLSASTKGNWDSTPVPYNGMIFVGSYGPERLYALNASNGSIIWLHQFNTAALSVLLTTPAIHNDVVFAGGWSNRLAALNATNGTSIWNFTASSSIYSSPAISGNDMVYFASLDQKIYGINETNGYGLWTYTTGGAIYSQPAIANGKFFIGSDDFYFRVFNLGTGTGNWTTLGYNESRQGFTPDGLTTHKYVNSSCSTVGSVVTCNVTNHYDKELDKIILKASSSISQANIDSNNLIFIDNGTLFLPKFSPNESKTVVITLGNYDSSIPKLSHVHKDYVIGGIFNTIYAPEFIDVINATYNSISRDTIIYINGTGSNANVTLEYPVTSSFNIYDDVYSNSTPFAEIRNDVVSNTRGNYSASHTGNRLIITIPTMSEHTLTISPYTTVGLYSQSLQSGRSPDCREEGCPKDQLCSFENNAYVCVDIVTCIKECHAEQVLDEEMCVCKDMVKTRVRVTIKRNLMWLIILIIIIMIIIYYAYKRRKKKKYGK